MGNIPRVHKPTYWVPINKEAKMKFPTKTIETQMNFSTNFFTTKNNWVQMNFPHSLP
jgi:hypothetical protein